MNRRNFLKGLGLVSGAGLLIGAKVPEKKKEEIKEIKPPRVGMRIDGVIHDHIETTNEIIRRLKEAGL